MGGKNTGLFAKPKEEEGEKRGETEGELESLGLLTSLRDSGESSVVVVVVEADRPEP